MNNYLIIGEDYVEIESKIKEIKKKLGFSDIENNNYDLNDTLLDNVLEDLYTCPLFSTKKVIIVRNFNKWNVDDNEKKINSFLKYLEKPIDDNLLILLTPSLDARKKENKDLKSKINIIEIDANPITFIKNKLKNYKIDFASINLINEYCLGNIAIINNELDKLINYKD